VNDAAYPAAGRVTVVLTHGCEEAAGGTQRVTWTLRSPGASIWLTTLDAPRGTVITVEALPV
jgi:hypothetical protein